MNVHKNAGLAPRGREILIGRLLRGERVEDVACAMGVRTNTVYKWRRRYREEGLDGLQDRSFRPHASPNKTPDEVELPWKSGPGTAKERRVPNRSPFKRGGDA